MARQGQLPLVAGAAGSNGAGAGAIDMAASPSGRNRAVFANGGLQIVFFTITLMGHLGAAGLGG